MRHLIRRHYRKTMAGMLGAMMTMAGYQALKPHRVVLYAQSLPTTVHYTWTPNTVSDAVAQYKVGLDAAPTQVVPVTACTATLCTATVTVTTEGAHTGRILAENVRVSTDPTTSFNDSVESPAITFTLKVTPPGPPPSFGVKN